MHLGRTIEQARHRFGVPGISVALLEGGRVTRTEAFGVTRSGGPVGAGTVLAVASLSKPPFAYLVLRLCERGVLDLDTPIAELMARPYDAYGLDPETPELKEITARHVLSHTSGMGNWEEDDVGRIGFLPGSRWHYSGEGFVYLQAAVEHVTGSPLEQLAETEVFEPLGMGSTGYLRPLDDGREFSRAYASHSLHTTAPDYARFVAHVLRSETGRAMQKPQVTIDDSLAWGLGWGLAGQLFWHWGEMDYFTCAAVASAAEGAGLVCLTNGDDGLDACAEILERTLGADYAYPIAAVLERGW
jgi:CubicO group peptidase (beta-lactamase class C family)